MKRTDTERITRYEAVMEQAEKAAGQMEKALEAYDAALALLPELESYYSGDGWKEDFAADEAGLLPESLKRGVLSEDGVWNLLERYRDLRERINPPGNGRT